MEPMDNNRKYIPEGVQDFLPRECFNKRELEKIIRKRFFLSGYNEVETPDFEYYDVFSSGIGSVRQEKMIKFIDSTGKILVLRPDITMPIARMAATRLDENDQPYRLFYIGNAYGYEPVHPMRQRAFTQAGIELLGIASAEADAEVIALAIEALLDTGLGNFEIEIGQVEFFKGLMEESGIAPKEIEELRRHIDRKNSLEAEIFLNTCGMDSSIKDKLMKLPSLYGGPEILEKAGILSQNNRCRSALQNIGTVYELLCQYGYEAYISIDLSMLQDIDYYSGVIFRGITGDLGYPLLTGGRYDGLIGEFGREMPATGFAMGIKRVLIALERQKVLQDLPIPEIISGCEKGATEKAYTAIRSLRAQNIRVELNPWINDQETLKEYAGQKGAKKWVFIGEKETIEGET
jgi:ATP phosphoribosyltransferase regulatory subunit